MRKILFFFSFTITFLIFGSFGLLWVREKIVYPMQDAAYLKSSASVADVLKQKQNYTYDSKRPIMWESRVLDVKPKSVYLADSSESQVLGDTTGNWIEINLSTQTLCFHETSGGTPCFPVSTGLAWTPTPTGNFHVWTKLPVTTMAGPGYYLPGVHWTMYFYNSYSTHEAYWHNNFGHPMSHGCVNMRLDDAKYIYDRSEVGTLVNVHT